MGTEDKEEPKGIDRIPFHSQYVFDVRLNKTPWIYPCSMASNTKFSTLAITGSASETTFRRMKVDMVRQPYNKVEISFFRTPSVQPSRLPFARVAQKEAMNLLTTISIAFAGLIVVNPVLVAGGAGLAGLYLLRNYLD